MLHLIQVEEIRDHLLRLPALVDRQQQGDRAFPEQVESWLRRAEDLLSRNRLAGAAAVAAARSSVVSAARGESAPETGVRGRAAVRKQQAAAAAEALRRAQDVIAGSIVGPEARIAEASDLMLRVVAAGARAGLPARPGQPAAHPGWLTEVWRRLATAEETADAAHHVLGLVGPQDSLILLDRALAQFTRGAS